jgi:hypothetical protein
MLQVWFAHIEPQRHPANTVCRIESDQLFPSGHAIIPFAQFKWLASSALALMTVPALGDRGPTTDSMARGSPGD